MRRLTADLSALLSRGRRATTHGAPAPVVGPHECGCIPDHAVAMPHGSWEEAMWFRKPAPVVCTVCSKEIASRERRFVEKNRTTKIERHTHVNCAAQQMRKGTVHQNTPRP